jgi:hypothetical protein
MPGLTLAHPVLWPLSIHCRNHLLSTATSTLCSAPQPPSVHFHIYTHFYDFPLSGATITLCPLLKVPCYPTLVLARAILTANATHVYLAPQTTPGTHFGDSKMSQDPERLCT